MSWTYFLPCLWAGLACGGFCLVFNVRTGLPLCCIGGALAWFAYLLFTLLGCGEVSACFLAAIVISLYAECMARIRKCPATGYLLFASFPLVPGAGIYYTMEYALQGNLDAFLAQGLRTLEVAGALALGVLLVSCLAQITARIRRPGL